jgi:hypothetical protein
MSVPSRDDELSAAREIGARAHAYLQASPEQARSQVPSDFAPLLPLTVGAPEVDGDGIRLGAWRLTRDGDRATLVNYPPGGLGVHHRYWFCIELARAGGAWSVVPPGVSFAYAWAKER